MMHLRHLASASIRMILLSAIVPAVLSGCGSNASSTSATTNGLTGIASAKSAPANDDTIELAATASAAEPLPKLRPGAPTKALAAAGDRTFDKTFDDIKFEMAVGAPFKRKMLTPAIEALNGQRIRIRGFMYPTPQQRGIKAFVLVRDNQECCFGPGAALYDCIFIEMQPGTTAEFSIRPVAVQGKFSVDEVIGPDGNHLAIYRIDAEEVQL